MSVSNFLKSLNKMVPKGEESRLADPTKETARERFKSGSLKLDIALGGGYVKGKMVELYGINQSGKTSAAIEAAVKFQEQYPDEPVMLIDLEDAYDPSYYKTLGFDVDKKNSAGESSFILARTKTGEEAFEYIIEFSKAFKGGLVIVDSISLLLPEKEDESDMGAHQMGSQARLMSQGLRKLFPHTSKNDTTILWINQTRETMDKYKPYTTSGGKAMGFYARTRLYLSRVKGEEDVSHGCNIKLDKASFGNKHEGYTINTFRLYRGKFDMLREILEVGKELGVLTARGSHLDYKGTNIENGFAKCKKVLQDNPEMVEEIYKDIMEASKDMDISIIAEDEKED